MLSALIITRHTASTACSMRRATAWAGTYRSRSSVGRESRQIKEVLRQRCFFVRQRTMLRNRIHRLVGAQHEVKLPQCSDLFGRKGLSFLDKLELRVGQLLQLAL